MMWAVVLFAADAAFCFARSAWLKADGARPSDVRYWRRAGWIMVLLTVVIWMLR